MKKMDCKYIFPTNLSPLMFKAKNAYHILKKKKISQKASTKWVFICQISLNKNKEN